MEGYLHLSTGEFLLFINFKQAAGFGHVGWGFKLDRGETYMFGSTDHLTRHKWWDLPAWINYAVVEPGEENDWWCGVGDKKAMFLAMSTGRNHIWYHSYKTIPVRNPSYVQAEELAQGFEIQGWSVLSNNCVHQTYELAKAYGVGGDIQDPWRNTWFLIPNNWFREVIGEQHILNIL